jgi:hypothetical protein
MSASRRCWISADADDTPAEQPILLSRAIEVAAQRGVNIEDVADGARMSVDLMKAIACLDDRPSVQL